MAKNAATIRVRATEGSLARVNVDLADSRNLRLRCQRCGQVWSPNLQTGGRLPRNWWQCPNRCNAKVAQSCGIEECQ